MEHERLTNALASMLWQDVEEKDVGMSIAVQLINRRTQPETGSRRERST